MKLSCRCVIAHACSVSMVTYGAHEHKKRMLVGKLTNHLRNLTSDARKATDGGRCRDQSYHSSLEGRPTLSELTGEVLAFHKGEGRGHRLTPSQQFSLQLLKRIILTQFELLCVSVELQDDVEYAFGECRCLCEHTSLFNTKMMAGSKQSKCLEFADFADVMMSTQVQIVLNEFLHEPSIENIVSLARFEQSFISALAAMFATFTSLIVPPLSSQKLKAVFVSEEMFSMAQSSNLTWLDCLIPGAQSEVLRLTVKDLIANLWSRVTSQLLAHIQPLVTSGKHTEPVLTLLRKAAHHPGKQLLILPTRLCNYYLYILTTELEHHTAVKKCFWYVVSAIEHQQNLSSWDQGKKLCVSLD